MDPLTEIGMHAGASPGIFKKAEMLRNKMTTSEEKMWNFLKKKPLGFKFRRQHPFGAYILDFYCHAKRLSIEIDGKNHSYQYDYDKERTNFINSLLVEEIRFQNEEVMTNFNDVDKIILEYLRADSL